MAERLLELLEESDMSEADAAVDDEVHVKKRQQVKICNTEIQSEVDKFSKILVECRKTLMDAKHRTNDEFISNLQLIKLNNENCNSKILVKLEKVEEIFSKVENIEKNYDLGNTCKDLTEKKSMFEQVRKKATDDLKEPITITVGDMNEKVTILNLSQELGLELKKPNFRTKGKFDRKLPK